MELFGIIFYVIIIVIFISAKKAAQGENSQKDRSTGSGMPGNYPRQKVMSDILENGKGMIQNISKNENKTIPNVPQNGKNITPNVPKNGRSSMPNVPAKKRREKTFMEPHREEKIQPKIRNNNLWGEDEHANRRIVALRLMEGDPVPEGYVKIKCPYCGADNLVTKHCKQYHSCYFCRVPID